MYTDAAGRAILTANGYIDLTIVLGFDVPTMAKVVLASGKDIPYWDIYKHTFADSSSYQGKWANGVPHGIGGKFVFADGVRSFEGEFVEGRAQAALPRLRIVLDRE